MVVWANQMIEKFKEISFYLVMALVITGLSAWVGSDFLSKYLEENLITLLIALLAINTTTSSVVMTKLKEIADATGGNFASTIDQLEYSIYEQIVYIVLAVVILILSGSKKVMEFHESVDVVLEILLVAVFVAAMHTLFDTAKSIFVILRYENRK